MLTLPPLYSVRKGGVFVDTILTSFVVSVVAGVVSHYLCKWLDGYVKK